jgi:5-formyltetrahydrofolate cyclo-ligase
MLRTDFLEKEAAPHGFVHAFASAEGSLPPCPCATTWSTPGSSKRPTLHLRHSFMIAPFLPVVAVAAAKSALRASLRGSVGHNTQDDARQACERLMTLLPATTGDVVAVFASMSGELATDVVAEALAKRNIGVALPRIVDDNLAFHLVPYGGWSSLPLGRFGIREPLSTWPRWPLGRSAWVLVPAMAVAFDGARLGRGRGFYDRCLADVPTSLRCGWINDDALVGELPTEILDLRMGWVVTPARSVRCVVPG